MKRTIVAVLGLVVIAGGAVAVVAATRTHQAGATSSTAAKKLSTVQVVQQDLTTYDQTTATLGFTTSARVSSPIAGTVTSIVTSGQQVDAGTTVAAIDGAPVVALIGDVPAYRALSTSSADGADVRELEQNLVLLGYDPAGKIAIDDHFDSATKTAVVAWETALGVTADGTVPQGRVVYIPGTLLVDTVSATVGGAAQNGSQLFVGRQSERKFLVAGTVAIAGQTRNVDNAAAAGTAVTTGTMLFRENGFPVVAIEGDPAAVPALTRSLSVGVADGADVKLLEEMLRAKGYDPNNAMTIDDHFDASTAAAVSAWWQAVGFTVDPAKVIVPAGSFVVVPSGLFVGTQLVANGTSLTNDAVVMTLTSAAREVSTTAPVGDATFAMGATIDVEFPDGTTQPGTVVSVGNVATNTSNTPGATPSVTIGIHVDNIPASVDSFVEIPVTLSAVAESEKDAFVVPVSALVALAEGGYALEEVTGTAPDGTQQTALIGVKPSLFSNGVVSVTGNQLKAGMNVVVPS